MLSYKAPRPSGAVLVLRWDPSSASCPRVLRTRRSRGAACGGACWPFGSAPWSCLARTVECAAGALHKFARRGSSGAACLLWSGAVRPGAVRAAAGPCVTQGLANDGALLMPGTGAEHQLSAGQPNGRALHDFGLGFLLVGRQAGCLRDQYAQAPSYRTALADSYPQQSEGLAVVRH